MTRFASRTTPLRTRRFLRRALRRGALLVPTLVAVLGAGGSRAHAGINCETTHAFFTWECVYRTSGWGWEKNFVGTWVQNPGCHAGVSLEGTTSPCYDSSVTVCGGTCDPGEPIDPHQPPCENTCTQDPSTCNAPPQPTCTGGPTAPADREAWLHSNGQPAAPATSYTSYRFFPVTNTSTRVGLGRYEVALPMLGADDGNVQVVAVGADATRCKVERWGGFSLPTSLGDMRVTVLCHAPTGAPADSAFLVQFLATDDAATSSRQVAYAAYSPCLAGDATCRLLRAEYQWNSAGARPTTQRLGVGVYKTRIPGQLHDNAAIHVTAVGGDAAFCYVFGNAVDSAGTDVWVLCSDTAGNPADSAFSLRHEWRQYTSAPGQQLEGYSVAGYPTTASYTPAKRFNAAGSTNLATRSGVGAYAATYPNLASLDASSTVMVSAISLIPKYCKLSGWSSWNRSVTANTRCYSFSGAPSDTAYAQSFLSRQTFLGLGP